MKLTAFLLVLCMLIPTVAQAAIMWEQRDPVEEYNQCVDELVRMRAGYEARLAEAKVEVEDARGQKVDAAVIGVAVGTLAATGGLSAIVQALLKLGPMLIP